MAASPLERIAAEALTIVALLASGGFILSHVQGERARSGNQAADTQSVRIALQDRMIGATIALPAFAGLEQAADVDMRRSNRGRIEQVVDCALAAPVDLRCACCNG